MFVRKPGVLPVLKQQVIPEVQDAAWFKWRLLQLDLCPLQVEWHYQEWFRAVPAYLMDLYIHHLPEYKRQGIAVAHVKALERAQGDYEALMLHPWGILD